MLLSPSSEDIRLLLVVNDNPVYQLSFKQYLDILSLIISGSISIDSFIHWHDDIHKILRDVVDEVASFNYCWKYTLISSLWHYNHMLWFFCLTL